MDVTASILRTIAALLPRTEADAALESELAAMQCLLATVQQGHPTRAADTHMATAATAAQPLLLRRRNPISSHALILHQLQSARRAAAALAAEVAELRRDVLVPRRNSAAILSSQLLSRDPIVTQPSAAPQSAAAILAPTSLRSPPPITRDETRPITRVAPSVSRGRSRLLGAITSPGQLEEPPSPSSRAYDNSSSRGGRGASLTGDVDTTTDYQRPSDGADSAAAQRRLQHASSPPAIAWTGDSAFGASPRCSLNIIPRHEPVVWRATARPRTNAGGVSHPCATTTFATATTTSNVTEARGAACLSRPPPPSPLPDSLRSMSHQQLKRVFPTGIPFLPAGVASSNAARCRHSTASSRDAGLAAKQRPLASILPLRSFNVLAEVQQALAVG